MTVSKSPTRIAFERLRADRVAMICAGIFVLFIVIAVFAPLLAKLEGQTPTEYHQGMIDDYGFPTIGMTSDHWFGIEPRLGRDLFARWVYGARPSLIVAVTVTIATTLVGVIVGLVAGFAGGLVDRVLSWFIDLVLSLPYLLFAIATAGVLVAMLGGAEAANPSEVAKVRFISLVLVLSFFGWAGLARLIRGQVLSLREREFIAAAKVLGVPTHKVLFKELLPNLVAPIMVSASLALPSYIVAEAGLTFLGVGLTEPTPSWGLTISAAQNYYRADPAYLWIPIIGITILVLALSLLGDAVRDAFDPRTRR
ncbi:ABC transporter permease [Plantactinospora sp. KBS50]|uniref:ABC transporter permease n=1 Tax=Plantactinospora sp. KBS50 TaxID=2024580 RepID=UPI001E2B3740|nr:ABC transporter permease [Plantactinospora sp. KBS50]